MSSAGPEQARTATSPWPRRGRRPAAGGASASSVSRARTNVQMAAAVAVGLPRICGELEAGRLERAVVDAAGDATERGDVGVGETGGLPRFFQRTPLKRDVQGGGVAPLDARREHPPLVRDTADERVTETGEIRRRVPRELPAD